MRRATPFGIFNLSSTSLGLAVVLAIRCGIIFAGDTAECSHYLSNTLAFEKQGIVAQFQQPLPFDAKLLLSDGPAKLDPSKLRFNLAIAENFESLTNGIGVIEIFYENKPIAISTLRRPTISDMWVCPNTTIAPSFQGNRLGTVAYLLLGKVVYEKTGLGFRSDPFAITDNAVKAWDSLKKLGYAVQVGSKSFVFNRSEDALSNVTSGTQDLWIQINPVYVSPQVVTEPW